MKKLSVNTAQLVSSLQVITRVESVVKELVENALDAGATLIEIKFENYGLSRIEVRDNGSGIKQDDVEFAAQRHYTSKISSTDDLRTLSSYGFRGEALHSICQVADVFLTTRTKSDSFSTKYSFNDKGIVTAVKPSHLGHGTTVVACNLFSKIPVRCQYYQSESKKKIILKNTQDLLMAFALIHPGRKLIFLHNKCIIWQTPACKDTLTTLQNIVGTQIASQMKKFDHYCTTKNILLSVLIPITAQTCCFRKTNDRIFVFVNERPIHDKEIEKAIKQQTSQAVTANTPLKWPLAVLNIKLPSHNVDANLEPDKSRLIISEKDAVLVAINDLFKEAYQMFNEENVNKGLAANTQIATSGGTPPSVEVAAENSHSSSIVSTNEVLENVRPTKGVDGPSTNVTNQCLVADPPHVDGDSPPRCCPTNESTIGNGLIATLSQDSSNHALRWSKGHGKNGSDIQPIRVLAGHYGQPNRVDSESADPSSLKHDNVEMSVPKRSNGGIFDNTSSMENNFQSNISDGHDITIQRENRNTNICKTRQPELNFLPKNRSSFRISKVFPSSRNSKALPQTGATRRQSLENSLITEWTFNPDCRTIPLSTPGSEYQDFKRPKYLNGQEKTINFDMSSIRNHFSQSSHVTAQNDSGFSVVGMLRDVKGGVLRCKNKKFYVVNLLRLHEMKLFQNLMKNHCFPSKNLKVPINIDRATLESDEKNGLELTKKMQSDNFEHDFEIIDDRIIKNGFRVFLTSRCIHVVAMSDMVSYLNVDDFKKILGRIGENSEISVADCRPYKAMQYLQSEAVRISRCTPIHLDNPNEIASIISNCAIDWKCFHNRPVFHPVCCSTETLCV